MDEEDPLTASTGVRSCRSQGRGVSVGREPVLEPGDTEGELALRLWRANREAIRFALVERDMAVVAHRPVDTLDLTLAPLMRSRIHGGTR
jgi:hypothetical protein